MKRMSLFLIPIIIFLSGCGTGYHSRGVFGKGYSEIMTNPDAFIVTFKGNGYTSTENVFKYALLRASELTLKNDYKYFVIISSADQTSTFNYSNTHANASRTANTAYGSSSTYSGTIIKPGTSIMIKCFKENPQIADAIDAEFYWNTNKED